MEGSLLPILHAFQQNFDFVPTEATALLARKLNLSRADVLGVESLEDAMRAVSPVQSNFTFTADEIMSAMAELPKLQRFDQMIFSVACRRVLHAKRRRRAVALARQGRDTSDGANLTTSRVSIALIQKQPTLAGLCLPPSPHRPRWRYALRRQRPSRSAASGAKTA